MELLTKAPILVPSVERVSASLHCGYHPLVSPSSGTAGGGTHPQGTVPSVLYQRGVVQHQNSLSPNPKALVCHSDRQEKVTTLLRVTPSDGSFVLPSR
jgi:hypothetical protein